MLEVTAGAKSKSVFQTLGGRAGCRAKNSCSSKASSLSETSGIMNSSPHWEQIGVSKLSGIGRTTPRRYSRVRPDFAVSFTTPPHSEHCGSMNSCSVTITSRGMDFIKSQSCYIRCGVTIVICNEPLNTRS